MTTPRGDSVFLQPKPAQSGVKAVLQYTGIPPSWLDKRPGLPSRNWLIFLSVTSAVTGYYLYDRRQCKKIREEFVDMVKDHAAQPLGSQELPRKVTVYGAKWLGDEEYDRSMKYFRKYVKPVLVAAAIDYDMVKGRRLGDIYRHVADDVRHQRRLTAGLDQPPSYPMKLPGSSLAEKRQRWQEGGIVLVGRHTFKEYMYGLKRGWTDPLDDVDREEKLARKLVSDGKFDESESEPDVSIGLTADDEPIPTPSRMPPSRPMNIFSSQALHAPPPPAKPTEKVSSMNAPPATIPPHPPLLLVSFTNYIGFTQIPLMIWDFFNERYKVRAGAEAALRLVAGNTRSISVPPAESLTHEVSADPAEPQKPFLAELSPSDLDFDREAETYYKKSIVRDYAPDIEKARKEYYEGLAKKLEITRALSRGTREPTKEERENPPPTEVELRTERFNKELRWTSDEEGWNVVRPDKDVEWDERFRDLLKVYIDPQPEQSRTRAPESEASS